jgi:threonine synthase
MDNISLKCIGCGELPDFTTKLINACKNRSISDSNHILEKHIPLLNGISIAKYLDSDESNPFSIYKDFFLSNYVAEKYKIDFKDIVQNIQNKLKEVDGVDFQVTPLTSYNNLFIKNETVNVGGSHKARHLMGNILYIEALLKAGVLKEKPNLSIYSCGNAAIAASVIAKAAGYELDVFIPPNVSPKVTAILKKNSANITVCPRQEGGSGDPCYNRFQESLQNGAVSFSCSGPDNWANIEGGETLILELMTQMSEIQRNLDSIVIQVGGGALASSAVHALEMLYKQKLIEKIPAIYTVQTAGCFPLTRAYFLLLKKIAEANGLKCSLDFIKSINKPDAEKENLKLLSYASNNAEEIRDIINYIKANYETKSVQDILKAACEKENSSFMWSWESEPESIAHGILDDITYDWFKLVQGMLKTGGMPVVVNENELSDANKTAKALTNINVDPTGSSGFSGLQHLLKLNVIPKTDNVAVFFTGVER